MILWPLREVVWHGKSCWQQHGCSVITLDENHLITCLEFKPPKTDDGERTWLPGLRAERDERVKVTA